MSEFDKLMKEGSKREDVNLKRNLKDIVIILHVNELQLQNTHDNFFP